MARSPFLRAIQNALPSRRQFLADGGMLALAGFTTRSGAAPRIGIVGGGIAGLTAALTLRDAGFDSTVYESSGRIGGRMFSNQTFFDGQVSEWCGEFINSSHTVMLSLASRFNLQLENVNAAQPPGSTGSDWFDNQYYLPGEIEADLSKIYPIWQEQRNAADYPTLYNSYTATGFSLDHLSVYDWIENYVPRGHSSKLGQLLDVALATEYGLDTPQQSALNLIYYATGDEKFHIATGNQALPIAIANWLPQGKVVLGWRLTAIVANADGTVSLMFNTPFNTPNGARQVIFDKVILALPFSVLRKLDVERAGFDSLKTTAITQLGYGTNSKLHLQFDDRYWNTGGPWGIGNGFSYTGLPFQSTWDASRAQAGTEGLLVDYTGGREGAQYHPPTPYSTSKSSSLVEQFAQQCLAQLERPWPGISAHYTGKATLSYPTGDPNKLGSYSCWKVGQYTQFSGYEKVAQGNIHFAGEHCSVNFQGYMEGGAREGIRAANEIIANHGS